VRTGDVENCFAFLFFSFLCVSSFFVRTGDVEKICVSSFFVRIGDV
jgi:hypothetical protein